jgi:predicted dinucleotide-binding enzyme
MRVFWCIDRDYPGIKDAVKQHTDRLAGKVVVDITNPVDTETCGRLAICAWELVP